VIDIGKIEKIVIPIKKKFLEIANEIYSWNLLECIDK
jgi:hypothetical protein